MPPEVAVGPVQGPRTTPGVVSKLRDDVFNLPVALQIVRSSFEELDVRSHDSKVMFELVPDFDRHLVAQATKRPLCPLPFELWNGHRARPVGPATTILRARERRHVARYGGRTSA